MTQEHPITPPPELIAKWAASMCGHHEAARWGADQELEACCEHLKRIWSPSDTIDSLRTARRPKPPSLKEQALAELEVLSDYAHGLNCSESAIRHALEQLSD